MTATARLRLCALGWSSSAALLLTSGCAGSHSSSDSTRHTLELRTCVAADARRGARPAGRACSRRVRFRAGLGALSVSCGRRLGASIERPTAQVWVARDLDARAIRTPDGAPWSRLDSGRRKRDVSHLYVAHLKIPRAGQVLDSGEARLAGGRSRGSGISSSEAHFLSCAWVEGLSVANADAQNCRRQRLCDHDARAPDRALLRYSIAESIAARKPFVVVFATPNFCTSRTCGPVVDVVDAVRKRFVRDGYSLHPRRDLQGQRANGRLQPLGG